MEMMDNECFEPLLPLPSRKLVIFGLGSGGPVSVIDTVTADRVTLPQRFIDSLERDLQERVLKMPKAPRS